ncbi:MAG: RsmE family RNA methyltransferase [Thermodesulfobacteriota bacterium]
MSRHRFFVAPDQPLAGETVLDGEEAHHLSTVLRLGPGAAIELLDGQGSVYQGEVLAASRRQVRVRLLEQRWQPPPARRLILAPALLKKKGFDLVLQKATELGVHALLPVLSHRCVAQAKDEVARWPRLVREAAKQCGARYLPELLPPRPLADLAVGRGLGLALHESAGEDLAAFLARSAPPADLLCLVGPEGGWDPEDMGDIRAAGLVPVRLGPRILRAETAALAAAAILQLWLGNLDSGAV